jgi:hypothetical protein
MSRKRSERPKGLSLEDAFREAIPADIDPHTRAQKPKTPA